MVEDKRSYGGGRWLGIAVGAAAAFAAAAVASLRWQVLSAHWAYTQEVRLADLGVVLAAVVAGAAGVLVSSRSARPSIGGWLMASGALAALSALTAASPAMSTSVAETIFACLTGMAVGGVLTAAAAGNRRQRLAVVVALMAGVLASAELTAMVRQAVPNSWGLPVHAAILSAVAALVAARCEGHLPAGAGSRRWTPVMTIAAVGIGVWVVASIRFSLLETLLLDGGRPSPRRADMVASFDQFALIAMPVAIALAFGAFAYRSGGRALTRWVIVGTVASYTFVTLNILGSAWSPGVVLVTAIATAGGAAAAAWSDRWVPWDAVGLVLCGWTTFVLATLAQSRSFTVGHELYLLLAGCLAFTLGAGVAAGIRSPSANGGGLVNAVLLGLVGMIFSAQLLRVLFPEADSRYIDGYPIAIPVVMTLAAVAVAVVWGMGKLVEKVRREVHAGSIQHPGATSDSPQ